MNSDWSKPAEMMSPMGEKSVCGGDLAVIDSPALTVRLMVCRCHRALAAIWTLVDKFSRPGHGIVMGSTASLWRNAVGSSRPALHGTAAFNRERTRGLRL
jgi:hypothetical protein